MIRPSSSNDYSTTRVKFPSNHSVSSNRKSVNSNSLEIGKSNDLGESKSERSESNIIWLERTILILFQIFPRMLALLFSMWLPCVVVVSYLVLYQLLVAFPLRFTTYVAFVI